MKMVHYATLLDDFPQRFCFQIAFAELMGDTQGLPGTPEKYLALL